MEYEEFVKKYGKSITDYYIEAINNYVPNAKPYKDYAAAIRQWYLRDKKEGKLPSLQKLQSTLATSYRDWETDRKSTRLNSSHSAKSRMPSSA